jgi:two-component system nitrogen regulation response regulator GlnG/two-component system response regulator HydG
MPRDAIRWPTSDGTTIAAESERGPARGEADANVLVVAWYPEDPERVGEIAVVPGTGRPLIFGRAGGRDATRILLFGPRRLEPRPPLGSRRLSREQLEIRCVEDELQVRRIGECPMHVNGVRRDEGVLRPGDTLRFGQTLVLLYTRRPARIPPQRYLDPAHVGRFGAADGAGIVGESPAIWSLRDRLAFAAKSGAHVLLTGESGTGKELAARAIHRFSNRASRPFVARNAATLPAGLIDAELFGNVRNYPNPGMPERPGLVGLADHGHLFLDEIGELPADLQAHLLRVLDADGEYQRLGDSVVRRADLCLLGATNRGPEEIKHDLAARFTVRVDVPPLSARREDIPWLIHHIVGRAAEKSPALAARFLAEGAGDRAAVRADARLVDELLRRPFKTNARELEAALWEAMARSEGDTIAWAPQRAAGEAEVRRPPASSRRRRNPGPAADAIRAALARAEGNVGQAAEAMGLSSRYALYRLMKKYGIAARE